MNEVHTYAIISVTSERISLIERKERSIKKKKKPFLTLYNREYGRKKKGEANVYFTYHSNIVLIYYEYKQA